jgi:hypothetical protein
MELFTFIMGYLGGTYISQVEARDKEQARDIWIRNLEIKEIESFTIKDKEDIIKENFSGEDIVLIKGMKNVWFFMVETEKGYGHVNLIKTKL